MPLIMVKSYKSKYNVNAREFEVLKLLSKGNTTNVIASILNIDQETVTTHRKNILKKFSVKNCAELIYIVTKLGLI